jgi:hypothetical protein
MRWRCNSWSQDWLLVSDTSFAFLQHPKKCVWLTCAWARAVLDRGLPARGEVKEDVVRFLQTQNAWKGTRVYINYASSCSLKATSRVTGWVWEKITQNVAQSIFCQNQNRRKSSPKMRATYFCNFVKSYLKVTITNWAKIRSIWSPWLPPYTLAGLDLTIHGTNLLGGSTIVTYAS